ncbi:type II toxin-antitoxin system PemK/MazF family toxin [Paracoccus tegillarcae]|uniref:Type II toxin-antitoxin system PemK/MazF family toxin n=1 Tax=Paracoccus tegillarcae TaxID=1529068 RepID=A0A2K9EES2_9RHOB|nr:type II toxin-antitoxin system PemK/MazF family toxin [Paracoccus tegillarcae]AUH33460.1 hypothetical protein CUV01_08710 [Paracoccus tegillarcae]
MAINFHPRAGQMLVADFSDLKAPEICKVRPVIVISPKLPFRSGLVAVVPVSLTPPRQDLPYVFRLSKNYHPDSQDDLACWAKCDLVMNIALWRLNGFKLGRRKWSTPAISPEDLVGVRKAVAAGLGLKF